MMMLMMSLLKMMMLLLKTRWLPVNTAVVFGNKVCFVDLC